MSNSSSSVPVFQVFITLFLFCEPVFLIIFLGFPSGFIIILIFSYDSYYIIILFQCGCTIITFFNAWCDKNCEFSKAVSHGEHTVNQWIGNCKK